MIHGDLFTQPLEEGAFDLVYSIGVLAEHAPLNQDVAGRVHRLLKPGGRFAFTTVHPDSPSIGRTAGRSIGRLLAMLPGPFKRPLRERLLSGGMYADEAADPRSADADVRDRVRRTIHFRSASALPVRGEKSRGAMSTSSRVLVLGGLGFIGANLCQRLIREGRQVTAFSRSLAPHAELARGLAAGGARIVEGDLRDAAAVAEAVADHDVIVNLAGESGAVRSMEAPVTDLDGNCRANLVLLEAMRAHNPRRQARVRGFPPAVRQAVQRYRCMRTIRALPLCVHAVHKNTIEEYLRVYGELFGLRYTIARVTNPYGPGQPRRPCRIRRGQSHDSPRARRSRRADLRRRLAAPRLRPRRRCGGGADAACRQCGRRRRAPTTSASGEGTALVDMAKTIIAIAGGGHVEHVAWPRLAEQIETGDFVADISRIQREIGWRPVTTLRDGIERTVAFHRARLPS